MVRTLYTVSGEIMELFDEYETDEEGEYDAEFLQKLKDLKMEQGEKRKAVGIVIKSKKAFLAALREEKKKIDNRIKSIDRDVNWLTDYLMADLQGEKMDTPEVRVWYTKTPNIVDIEDGVELSDEWMRITKTPNKTALKEALLDGEKIDGVRLIDKVSMVIK